MISAYLAYQFAGLWALVWHFGVAGLLIVGFLAAAWFSPIFKKDFIWAAVVVAAFSVAVAIGVNLGEKRVRAQWDASLAAAISQGKKARSDAERYVDRNPLDRVRSTDRFNRDKR